MLSSSNLWKFRTSGNCFLVLTIWCFFPPFAFMQGNLKSQKVQMADQIVFAGRQLEILGLVDSSLNYLLLGIMILIPYGRYLYVPVWNWCIDKSSLHQLNTFIKIITKLRILRYSHEEQDKKLITVGIL